MDLEVLMAVMLKMRLSSVTGTAVLDMGIGIWVELSSDGSVERAKRRNAVGA